MKYTLGFSEKDNCAFVLGRSAYDFDGDKVEVFSDGTYYLNGKEATEEQRYEIEQNIKKIEESL